MGYIKKLKNNELVGGTDKHTIYPVTSTEAVFEETINGSESSFKSQKTINNEHKTTLNNHEERIRAAEAEDIKSITINGSTKKFEADDKNNVDLTIYTVDSDPEMPSIANNVEDLRNMVGTSTPVLETSHKTRIETLEGSESVTGSVENKIKAKVDTINSSFQDDNNEYVKYSMTQTSGKITDFNIDETSLKNAITSLNTSISGDNIVIRSGSTPSGTGEAGKIYRYVNSSNNTYTDYMYSGGNWVTLATHDTSDEQAQVAYYTCTATGSGAQATKQFVSNGSLEYTPSSGGHIKILMGEANTADTPVYLQYNSDNTNTKKQVYYNGEPVSPGNTWEKGEIISVYYDGTYYQATNVLGGGGGGIKIIKPNATGKGINLSGTTIGSPTNYTGCQYALISVNKGDVILISGVGGSDNRLWAFADSSNNNTIVSRAEASIRKEHLLLVAPENADTLCINNVNTTYPNPVWLYAKSGNGGDTLLKDTSFLHKDIPRIKLGTLYNTNDVIMTEDNQRRKFASSVTSLNNKDAIAVGEYKVYSGNTYRAENAIGAYFSNVPIGSENYPYSSGDMAAGTPSIATITINDITHAQGNMTVTFGEVAASITITSESNAANIASEIASAFNVEGWTFSSDDNVVTALKNDVGATELGDLYMTTSNLAGINTTFEVTEGTVSSAAKIELNISMNEGTISVTLGNANKDIAVVSTDDKVSVASKIVTNITNSGWSLVDNEDGTITAYCNTGGTNTLAFGILDTDNTGVSGSAQTSKGIVEISTFDGTSWSSTAVTVATILTYIGDTPITLAELIEGSTVQDWLYSDFKIKDIVTGDLEFADDKGNVLVRFSNGHIKTEKFDSATFEDAKSNLWEKKMNIIGDSYVRNHVQSVTLTWHYLIAEENNMTYRQYGINGNGLVAPNATGTPVVERYTSMDNDADYVIVAGGRNDYNVQLSIASFKSGLETLCSGLLDKYMSRGAKICFFTPWADFAKPSDDPKSIKLTSYADAIREVCGRYAIPVFDNRSSSMFMFKQSFRTMYAQSSSDDSHLNANGHRLFKPKAFTFLNSL